MNLEHMIQALSDKLTYPNGPSDERARIEAQIDTARQALTYYRKAYDLEQKLPLDLSRIH